MRGKLHQYKSNNNPRRGTFNNTKSAFDTTWNVKVVARINELDVPSYMTAIVDSFLPQRKAVLDIQGV